MTNRTRFCVLFTGAEGQPTKTRLLHSDSDKEDIRLIWKQIYNDEAPADAELIISENCVYRLDDEEDLLVFFAQAEDQYKLLPSQPLKVILGNSAEYFQSRNSVSPSATKDERASPTVLSPNNFSKHMTTHTTIHDVATDLSTKRSNGDANSNNNNRHNGIGAMKTSPTSKAWSPSFHKEKAELYKDVKSEPASSWTPTNSLLSLYNRFRGDDQAKMDSHKASANSMSTNYSKTIGGVIDSITSASGMAQTANLSTRETGYHGRLAGSEATQSAYENPYVAYTKHLAKTLGAQAMSNPADISKNKETQNGFPETSTSLAKPPFNLSAYSAFVNTLQEQRLMQNSPSASYILQTIFNNHMKGSTQKPEVQNGLTDSRLGSSYLDQKSALNSAFMSPQMLMKSPNHTSTPHAFQDTRSSSLLSSLAHHNSNSLLSYMNTTSGHSMHNGEAGNGLEDLIKKTQKKRRRNGMTNENGKPMDSTKRMRSSISQSNIEYHYQRAVDYSQMGEDEQKLQNSAHRSHWKHLLFVAERSPKFLERFKHAKYDEWSSEARDIFAICQPDKYMWSFLTLSKQGDMLCKRIMARIDTLLSKSTQDRPEWCPEDEMLIRAQTRARERLGQLQRILYSRSMNQEAKAAEKASELEKLSMQEKNIALVTAYHQRQQELIQNHQAMVKHAVGYHHLQQQQEHQRPSVVYPNGQTTHCSSLTSSPISMASPAFEENSTGSGCSESPSPAQQNESPNEGSLVIAEDKESDHSPNASEDSEVRSVSPQPFVQPESVRLSSPLKWSKIEQAADV